MDLGLKAKRAMVLGGSRGIGWFTAQLLRQEGASVALCARGADGVAAAVAALQPLGEGPVHGAAVDLADAAATRAFVRDGIAALGGLDILIHNASAFKLGAGEEEWRQSFEIDIMAGVRAVDEALPALKEGGGSITFIGSMASAYHFGMPTGAYGASKAAMRTFANELAQKHGRHGIRANVVSPGAVWFPDGSWDKRRHNEPDFYRGVEKSIPLGRLGTGEELARIIVFVASPAGQWINSTHIVADGGQVPAVD